MNIGGTLLLVLYPLKYFASTSLFLLQTNTLDINVFLISTLIISIAFRRMVLLLFNSDINEFQKFLNHTYLETF